MTIPWVTCDLDHLAFYGQIVRIMKTVLYLRCLHPTNTGVVRCLYSGASITHPPLVPPSSLHWKAASICLVSPASQLVIRHRTGLDQGRYSCAKLLLICQSSVPCCCRVFAWVEVVCTILKCPTLDASFLDRDCDLLLLVICCHFFALTIASTGLWSCSSARRVDRRSCL